MKRLFSGSVIVETRNEVTPTGTVQDLWVEHFCIWAADEEWATGYATRRALEKHPGKSIKYVKMYDVTEVARMEIVDA